MTRLTHRDIDQISAQLLSYNEQLTAVTGCGLLDIACHCYGVDVGCIRQRAKSIKIDVIPVTAGLGVISSFSETVTAILRFLGFNAKVSEMTDVAGFASAFEGGSSAFFMADDKRFIGFHWSASKIIDNGEATGHIYAAALSLMARGISGKEALVIGCGPVGLAGAEWLVKSGGRVTLFDLIADRAFEAKKRIIEKLKPYSYAEEHISIGENAEAAIAQHDYILDATPTENILPDELLNSRKRIAIPGVPPGLTESGLIKFNKQVVHDKLELGVASMAVGLVL